MIGMRMARLALTPLWLLLAVACSSESSTPPPAVGPHLRMNFAETADFFAAPFPSDHRLDDGVVQLDDFPNPASIPFVAGLVDLLDGRADGFSATGGVFFSATAPLDLETLPSLDDSVGADASVFVVSVDAAASDYLERYPITVAFHEDGGPFGAANLLSVVPLQGMPLEPRATYAVVVTTDVRDASGNALRPSTELASLVDGSNVAGLSEAARARYDGAIDAVVGSGTPRERLAGLAAFTTWDGTAGMHALAEHARTLATPTPTQPWALSDVFDEYCVYESQLEMPVYQGGEPPYDDTGGGIVFEQGVPVLDHEEAARIVVTVPRAPAPAGGWPVAVMVRTGGGGDRPLVDRGVRDAEGNVAIPGSGPALHFTRAGFAGVSVDGPHGGIRNVTGGDEQFLIFNIENPTAMRDNIRQSALELALLPDVLQGLGLAVDQPGAVCPDAGASVEFDVDTLAIMGHSMGATISPLTLAVEPRYRAVVLSGAGGSWIENVVHKQSPVAVKPLAEILLHYASIQRSLHEHDPVLTLLQWAGEPADPPIYLRHRLDGADAPHVLMLQGIVDTYILPPIANATALSLGLDQAGEVLDEGHPELATFTPLRSVLPFVAGEELALPVTANHGDVTAVVVQHAEGPIEDGHEVAFQTEGPKHQYRCFLRGLRDGAPTVPVGASEDSSCAP
jgi:hypothetical protein